MKIAWFTPFWRHSAIGTFSRHVTERLSRVAEVELWIPEAQDCQNTDLPIVEFDPALVGPELPAGIDVAVYNLGNNMAFHQAVLKVARKVPGLVILHDSVLHHLFLDESRFEDNGFSRYLSALRRWYGHEVADEALGLIRSDAGSGYPPIDFCASFPLLEEATLGALGVVVHSSAQLEQLRPWWLGPMTRLDLPSYKAEHILSPPEPAPPGGARLNVLSVGWVGQAKQTHVALSALAAMPNVRDRVAYRIAGPIAFDSDYGRQLVRIVEEGSLETCVELLGFVGDDELEDLLHWADVFINLRWPSTEGGSASLAEQLLRGLPVIVTRTGIFDELPDDSVVKVEPNDPAAVAAALDRLADDETERHAIGRAGWQVAHTFTIESYARGVHELVTSLSDWELPLTCLDRVGDILAEFHADPALEVFRTVGAELSQMFGTDFSHGRPMARPSPKTR